MSPTRLPARIPDLARLLDGTGIAVLTLTSGTETVTLRRRVSLTADPATEPGRPWPATVPVTAPCPGIVLLRHPLRQQPLVTVGQQVSAGDPVALLRVGPLLIPVAAGRDGMVAEVTAAEGDLAGYGTVLVRLHDVDEQPSIIRRTAP